MVERIARAMHAADRVKSYANFDDESDGNQWAYRNMAKAALTTLREPTEAMLNALTAPTGIDNREWREHARNDWHIMHDAVLKE